jgi:hypothetical protein
MGSLTEAVQGFPRGFLNQHENIIITIGFPFAPGNRTEEINALRLKS